LCEFHRACQGFAFPGYFITTGELTGKELVNGDKPGFVSGGFL